MLRMNSVFDGCKKSENERCIQPSSTMRSIHCGVRGAKNERCIQQGECVTLTLLGCKRRKNGRCIQRYENPAFEEKGVKGLKMKGAYSPTLP